MRKNLDSFAILSVIGLCLMWGFQQVVFKAATRDIAPLMLVVVRNVGGALLVWAFARWGLKEEWTPGLWRRGGLAVGLAFGLEFLFLAEGLRWTSASHAGVFLYTAPLFVAVGLHSLVPEERLRGAQLVGVSLAFLGIVVAFLGPAWFGGVVDMPSSRWLWGDAMVLCAGLCFAAVNLIVRTTALAEAPPAQTLFYQLVGGSVLAVPAVLVTEQYRFEPTMLSIGSMLYQTIGITFFSYLAWFALFQRYSVNRLSVLTFFTPVFGVLLGVVLLGERLAAPFVAGAALVLAGVAMVNGRDWWDARRMQAGS